MATAAERKAQLDRIKKQNEERKQRRAGGETTTATTAALSPSSPPVGEFQESTPGVAIGATPQATRKTLSEAEIVSAISGGAFNQFQETTPGVNVTTTPQGMVTNLNLPRAFIPAKTVVDTTGTAVIVDINGRDENGNIVKVLPEGATGSIFGEIDADISFLENVIANAPALGAAAAAGRPDAVITGQGLAGSPTTSMDVIKAGIRALGLKGNIVDSGANFINSLLIDGVDFDNAIDIFLENKEYTFKNGNKLNSPFYSEYGFLNEYAAERKEAGELFGLVTGIDQMVKKYNLSAKFGSREKLIEMVKNDISVEDFDKRANLARLKAITADPVRVDALRRLGFIRSNEDLTDFYLDTTIGVEKFEDRRRTAYLTTEALRRASAGITIDAARMTQLAATLGAQGYTAEQVERLGAESYETISQQLPELTKLSGIFERGEAVKPQDIQQELESEQLLGMASQRRKRLEQANIDIFSGKAGRAYTQQSTAGLV